MDPKDLDKLIEKYLDGRCTAEECAFIDSWYAKLGKNPDASYPVESGEEAIAEAGARILKNVQAHGQQPIDIALDENTAQPLFWKFTGIAASILLVAAVGFYMLPKNDAILAPEHTTISPGPSIFENSTNEVRRLILPDGSIVTLSPSSMIRYSDNHQTHSRELYLEGEAYFDVAHNNERPFYVYADNIVTKVLGTSFIVRAIGSDEKVTVSVKTGKVTVYTLNATHKKTVLVPNQEAVYDRRTDSVATKAVPVLKERIDYPEMNFEETPVPEVLAMLAEAYDIDILFREDKLSGCVLTSSFLEEGLYDRIDVICTAIGATYSIMDARIVIESNGCNIKTN